MSTSDGYVGGTTKIVDHGPANSRWNMVILSEGYRASEIPQFHLDAQRFVDHLYATAPFGDLWCGVNVYTVDVVSTDSGADDPIACADDTPGDSGSGATPATYFDATFCTNNTRRLVVGDQASALNVSHAAVPEVHVTMVIVNSSRYGGAGGSVGWFSTDPSSAEVGIHEMGHTFFGLTDEYGDIINTFNGAEPAAPNATKDTNRNTTKWADLILPATPVPTTSNPDCSTENIAASPVAVGTVGLFEGAGRAHCGLFRAENSCRMRSLGQPFCAVCERRIRTLLAPFVPPTTLTLTTPSIDFGGVPEGLGGTGVTTYRAIVFDLAGCDTRTLEMIAGPTGGFGTPLGTSEVVNADEYSVIAKGRLWLSYTSTTDGDSSNGSVTVRCVETGEEWDIDITAHTIARPKSAVALVLDRSGSMSEDSGDGTPKVEKLKQAVSTFAGLMLDGDGVGVVSFDDVVDRLSDVLDVGPTTPVQAGSGRERVNQIVAGSDLDPRGDTSIGGGVQEGKAVLDDAPVTVPPWAVKAMLVVTDGVQNTPPTIEDASTSLTANTFAIGIGLPSNISVESLDALTQNHDGYMVVTGAFTQDAQFRLTKYFLQVLAGVTNAAVVVDPQGRLTQQSEHRIPFPVSEADYGVDAIVLCEYPQLLDVRLETPGGATITTGTAAAEPNIEYVRRDHASFYRIGLPAIPADPGGTHAGKWELVLRVSKRGAKTKVGGVIFEGQSGGVDYSAIVHAYSSLQLDASAHQESYAPHSEVMISATLREYGVPVQNRAKVFAEVTRPDAEWDTVVLEEHAAGRFEGSFRADMPGVYTIRVRANGTDFHGFEFARERTLAASIWRGRGPRGGEEGDGSGERLERLLHCLLEQAGEGPVRERAERLGIDLDRLRKCMGAGRRKVTVPVARPPQPPR